jgi:hypothetical protein
MIKWKLLGMVENGFEERKAFLVQNKKNRKTLKIDRYFIGIR